MSILIMVLIARMIILKLKYKVLCFQAGPSQTGLKIKIAKAQMGLAREIRSFFAYRTKLKIGNF